MSVAFVGAVVTVPDVRAADVAVIAPKEVTEATPEALTHTPFSDGYWKKTDLDLS